MQISVKSDVEKALKGMTRLHNRLLFGVDYTDQHLSTRRVNKKHNQNLQIPKQHNYQSEGWNVVMLYLGALGSGLLVMVKLFGWWFRQGVKGLAFEPNQLQGVYLSLVHVLV